MFNLFKCNHPISELMVKKDQTVEQQDADFDHVTYHFVCMKCGKDVNITYAKLRGDVVEFLKRKE
jgi:Fe2+ or Zn2+ uptake regulation protein